LDVSHATVSRALNKADDPFISESTRKRVIKAALEMGYRSNHAARSLVTGRTGLVSFWIWSESRPGAYHARVSYFMQSEFEQLPYQLVIHMVGYKTLEFAQKKEFSPWSVDGIIAHESGPAILALLGDAGSIHFPVVSTGSYNLIQEVDTVYINLDSGAEKAMHHLIAPGCKRVAYMTNVIPAIHESRYGAYSKVMKEAGLQEEVISVPAMVRAQVRETAKSYIKSNGVPDAILCHNDDIAIGLYRALCDLGIRTPDDVALVGCDGIEDTEYLETPISTIVQPHEQMCTLARQFLENRMEDPTLPLQKAVLFPEFVIRESSMR
jgi:DNA-binding LacI/PurR family transcriptional regulator